MEKGSQMRFTDEELALVRSTFKGNDKLLKLLRKVFLPEYDPEAPLGQVIDLWMTVDFRGMSTEQIQTAIIARNSVITHIETRLIELKSLSEMKEETAKEKEEREKADSTK